jgi:hypothetical protein
MYSSHPPSISQQPKPVMRPNQIPSRQSSFSPTNQSPFMSQSSSPVASSSSESPYQQPHQSQQAQSHQQHQQHPQDSEHTISNGNNVRSSRKSLPPSVMLDLGAQDLMNRSDKICFFCVDFQIHMMSR